MLEAATEAEALAQAATLAHGCGELSFAAQMARRHDAAGLWLVFRGTCPRCQEAREVRFLARPPPPRVPAGPTIADASSPALVVRGGSEEDELYRQREVVCPTCNGAGEWDRMGGDYASMETVRCYRCRGSGRAVE